MWTILNCLAALSLLFTFSPVFAQRESTTLSKTSFFAVNKYPQHLDFLSPMRMTLLVPGDRAINGFDFQPCQEKAWRISETVNASEKSTLFQYPFAYKRKTMDDSWVKLFISPALESSPPPVRRTFLHNVLKMAWCTGMVLGIGTSLSGVKSNDVTLKTTMRLVQKMF